MAIIDFSGIVQNAGIQLEQQAFRQFGAVVDDYAKQSIDGIFGPGDNSGQSLGGFNTTFNANALGPGTWRGTNYAADLITYQPKHRFLFKVIFELDPKLIQDKKLYINHSIFQYIIRHIDRPKATFQYEDVNMYNFYTKVLKKIEYEPMTITLIDDIQNIFHQFYNKYLSLFSPATRTYNDGTSLEQYETGGFNFSSINDNKIDSARRGSLHKGIINPLKSIKIVQIYGHGTAVNEFRFINPRIIDISFDELKHEGGDEGNHATIRFDYDVLAFTSTGESIDGQATNPAPISDYFAPNRGPGGPFKPQGMYNDSGFYAPDFTGQGEESGGGFMNGIIGTVGNVASSAVGSVFSSVSAQSLSKIGGGALGNIVGNSVVAPITRAASGAVGNTISKGLYNITNSNIISDYFKSNSSEKITED